MLLMFAVLLFPALLPEEEDDISHKINQNTMICVK